MTNPLCAPLEALLLMATEPVPAGDLATAVDVPVADVTAALQELAQFYTETGRGFELRHVGGGWRYYPHPDQAGFLAEWVVSDASAKLSQAALETLAVIAYLQPISRGRVSAVRGVNVDGVVRTLTTRGLIETLGVDPETGAALFSTTDYFLERMGLNTLDDLPALAPNLPDAVELESELSLLATTVGPAGGADPADAPHAAEAPETKDSHD